MATTAQQLTINLDQAQQVGRNLRAMQNGDLLILVIDTTKTIGPSSTGKMTGVGSTGGFQNLINGLRGNVYVGRNNS